MAQWKKVVVSGSAVSQLNNDANYIAQDDSSVSLSGSFSGSFFGDGSGLSGVAATFPISTATATDALKYFVNDGASKYITGTTLSNYVYGKISGDATVAAGGALTIAANAVEGSMLNNNVISGQTAMTGDVADTDELLISDAGTLKRADFSVVRDAVFNDVSGDATIAAGGALTIAADSVEGTMLNTNVADTTTITLSSDTLSVLKVPNDLTIGNGLAASSAYNGSAARTVAVGAGTHITVNTNDIAVNTTTLTPAISGTILNTIAGDVNVSTGGVSTIQASAVEGTMLNSNVADGTTITLSSNTLSTLKVPNALTAGSGLSAAGTFDGANARTFTVNSGSMLSYYSSSIQTGVFAKVSGDITISGTGTATIGSNAVALGSNTTGNYVATIANATNGGITVSNSGTETAAVTLALNAANLANVAPDNQNDKVVIVDDSDNGTKTVDIQAIISDAAGTNLSADAAGVLNLNDTIVNDITFAGTTITFNHDIVVQGTASFQNTTNLEVADKFILLNSGSATDNSPGGIVVQQNVQDEGVLFGYDAAAASNNGRWGVTSSFDASSATFTADAYVAMVIDEDASQTDIALYQQRGNLKIDTSDEIWIYV